MCASCFTNADALTLTAAAAGTTGWRWVRSGLGARRGSAADRWEATASFLRELGHDPVSVLGPKPA